ncbi:hypothetical protein CANCADRAFT_1090 [Tortispora caseinolytica NRRL Y-17796]|uniref:J domain-containing protein n=1 Tax=Tortispora caseinolytica NRRL Y-17796 TaxID=767744 RepID=A0A1E4TL61_9ASCO|nr:hypothetical protein CANCADRAFT_1090 [Tortispora caseinolytica NRRL Y-17796]
MDWTRKAWTGFAQGGRCVAHRHYSTESFVDHYKVLQVKPDASVIEIKRQFYKLSQKLHPDKFHSASDEECENAKAQFLRVKESYDVLRDTTKRREYDNANRNRTMRSSYSSGGAHFRNRPTGSTNIFRSRVRRSNTAYTSSGKERPKYSPSGPEWSQGKPLDYSSESVPHFDYDRHFKQHYHRERTLKDKHDIRREQERRSEKHDGLMRFITGSSVLFLTALIALIGGK